MRRRETHMYEALVNFVQIHRNDFLKAAADFLLDPKDAQEAVNGAVSKSLDKFKKIKNQDQIESWFMGILKEDCERINKKNGIKKKSEPDTDWEFPVTEGAFFNKEYRLIRI